MVAKIAKIASKVFMSSSIKTHNVRINIERFIINKDGKQMLVTESEYPEDEGQVIFFDIDVTVTGEFDRSYVPYGTQIDSSFDIVDISTPLKMDNSLFETLELTTSEFNSIEEKFYSGDFYE